jgi:hypothetical protein
MRGISRSREKQNAHKVSIENFKRRYRFGDLGGGGYVILLHKYDVKI